MPLRDHFHPPLSTRKSWEGFHGQWPAKIVEHLNAQLPPEFEAEPRVHLGSAFEIDVATYESEHEDSGSDLTSPANGGIATATWSPGRPKLLLEGDVPTPSEYEVLVYDVTLERRLVAAVELVSPSNKDRPDNRRAFVNKCEALLQKSVCVVIVDVVTIRSANFYCLLAEQMGAEKPAITGPIYAVSCRGVRSSNRWRVESWEHQLVIGEPLPTVPLWLNEKHHVPLNLEASYEDTCRVLRIR